jgi:hypothetical protein
MGAGSNSHGGGPGLAVLSTTASIRRLGCRGDDAMPEGSLTVSPSRLAQSQSTAWRKGPSAAAARADGATLPAAGDAPTIEISGVGKDPPQ